MRQLSEWIRSRNEGMHICIFREKRRCSCTTAPQGAGRPGACMELQYLSCPKPQYRHQFSSVQWLGEFWALLYQRVRWVELCSSLSILWYCLSLGLEWKLTFSTMYCLKFLLLSGYHVLRKTRTTGTDDFKHFWTFTNPFYSFHNILSFLYKKNEQLLIIFSFCYVFVIHLKC